jgi:hypothetical protein
VDGVPLSYGLGLDMLTIGERQVVGHSGGFPGFVTNTRIDPAEQLVLVALTNADDGGAADLTAGMIAIVNRAMEAEPAPGDQAPADLDRFTGRYWSLGGATDIVRFGRQLLGLYPELPTPTDPVVELTLDGTDELLISNAPGFASPGERVRFSFDHAGHVERVQWAALTLHPWEIFRSRVLASVRETRRGPSPAP